MWKVRSSSQTRFLCGEKVSLTSTEKHGQEEVEVPQLTWQSLLAQKFLSVCPLQNLVFLLVLFLCIFCAVTLFFLFNISFRSLMTNGLSLGKHLTICLRMVLSKQKLDIVSHTFSHDTDDLSMWLEQCIPVCRLTTSLQGLFSFLCTLPHSFLHYRLPLKKRIVFWADKIKILI